MGMRVDPLVTGLHSATFRTIWSACVAWLIYISATGNNTTNLLNKLLSWQGFQLPSRLTYAAYLVHPLVIYYHFGTLTERLDSSMFAQFHRFMANWIITYVLAFLLALFIEAPSLKLQQLLMAIVVGKKRKTTTHISRHNNDNQQRWSTTNSDIVTCASTASNLQTTTSNSTRETSENGSIADNNGASQSNPINILNLNVTTGDRTDRQLLNSKLSARQHKLQTATNNSDKQTITKQPIVTCNGKHLPEAIALDTDFQLKLSQAISRGFKIRSQLVEQKLTSSKATTSGKSLKRLDNVVGQTIKQTGGGQSKVSRRKQHDTNEMTTNKIVQKVLNQENHPDHQASMVNSQNSENLLFPLSVRKDRPRKDRGVPKMALSLDDYHHNHLNHNNIHDEYRANQLQQYHPAEADVILLDRNDSNNQILLGTHRTNENSRHHQDVRHLSRAQNYQHRQMSSNDLEKQQQQQQQLAMKLDNQTWTSLMGLATAQ